MGQTLAENALYNHIKARRAEKTGNSGTVEGKEARARVKGKNRFQPIDQLMSRFEQFDSMLGAA